MNELDDIYGLSLYNQVQHESFKSPLQTNARVNDDQDGLTDKTQFYSPVSSLSQSNHL